MINVPVWVFHARNDPSIPLAKNERAVSDLNAVGGAARITIIESDRHYV
jgi:predicted peptidase